MARFVRTPSPLSLTIALVALLGCTTPPPPKPSSPAQSPPPSTPQKPSPAARQEAPSETQDRKEETAAAASESAERSTDTGREDSMSQPPEGGMAGVEQQQDPSASTGSAGVSTDGGSAESRDELAALEQQLNESLAAYDEALAQQQEAMAEERTATANGQAEASAEASGVAPSDRAGEASAGGASAGHQGGGPGAGAPSERDPADGEDVVARQLRKAAEAEKDPVLREKIWDEYRRYTGREPGPEGEGATPP